MKFKSYEIAFVGKFWLDGQKEACIERLTEGEPEKDDSFIESFWTLYGRFSDGRAIAVFNSNCFQGCLDIYENITGHEPDPNLPTPGWEELYEIMGLPV
jgi:hypothetical protein